MIAAGLLASTGAPALAATTYVAFDDFQVVGGVIQTGAFTVGSSVGAFTGAITPFTTAQVSCGDGAIFCLRTGDSSIAKAYAGTYDPANSVFFRDGYLNLHPNPGMDTIVQFIAPTAGTYSFEGRFAIHDSFPTGVGIAAYVGSAPQFTSTLGSGESPFDFDVTLAAGGTVSFGLSAAGSHLFDSTGFKLTVTELDPPTGAIPEPATWAMMIMGFAGAGAALRRRRDQLA
ncbi:MAG: PEPxxWA-CTERM sorting domain-containing protein [Phenylobacterium sp.]|nr:PEPxxWA-CTERM sorting domain-containing protein [Phenylobacterium sp.]